MAELDIYLKLSLVTSSISIATYILSRYMKDTKAYDPLMVTMLGFCLFTIGLWILNVLS